MKPMVDIDEWWKGEQLLHNWYPPVRILKAHPLLLPSMGLAASCHSLFYSSFHFILSFSVCESIVRLFLSSLHPNQGEFWPPGAKRSLYIDRHPFYSFNQSSILMSIIMQRRGMFIDSEMGATNYSRISTKFL